MNFRHLFSCDTVNVVEDLAKLINTINSDHVYQIILEDGEGDFKFIFDVNLDLDGGNPKLELSSIEAVTSLTNTRDLIAMASKEF